MPHDILASTCHPKARYGTDQVRIAAAATEVWVAAANQVWIEARGPIQWRVFETRDTGSEMHLLTMRVSAVMHQGPDVLNYQSPRLGNFTLDVFGGISGHL